MTEILDIDVSTLLQFSKQDFKRTIIESLYFSTPELGSDLNQKIQARTPVLTGALQSSEKFTPNTSPEAGSTLVSFAPQAQEQQDAWGRVYAPYVEGLLPSSTIASPAEMYGLSEEEDIGDIELWAYTSIDEGAKKLAASQGVIP